MLLKLTITLAFSSKRSYKRVPSLLNISCDQAGKGKKERLIQLLHESSAAPQLRYLSTRHMVSFIDFYFHFIAHLALSLPCGTFVQTVKSKKLTRGQINNSLKTIVGFHMTSLKFKLNYRSYRDLACVAGADCVGARLKFWRRSRVGVGTRRLKYRLPENPGILNSPHTSVRGNGLVEGHTYVNHVR